jgi:hypothetical protein
MTYKWLDEAVKEILDKFTIDPNSKVENGLTAKERMISYILAAIDNIERELE